MFFEMMQKNPFSFLFFFLRRDKGTEHFGEEKEFPPSKETAKIIKAWDTIDKHPLLWSSIQGSSISLNYVPVWEEMSPNDPYVFHPMVLFLHYQSSINFFFYCGWYFLFDLHSVFVKFISKQTTSPVTVHEYRDFTVFVM